MKEIRKSARRLKRVLSLLDERARRIVAGAEALELGYGGISAVSDATGLCRAAITRGIRELAAPAARDVGGIRQAGGGRKRLEARDPDLPAALERLVEPLARGDPDSPLRWTVKSTRRLARELARQGHPVGHVKISYLLGEMQYSLQGNRKTEEGKQHPDRNAQFEHINAEVTRALAEDVPVISVDTKKKEVLGNYANGGREWRPAKQPRRVQGHDFHPPEEPRALLYGVYDLGRNRGFVNVGTDHDTGAFAVASVHGWWRHEGRRLYRRTRRILITADGGGSNGYRLRQWKVELQRFADATGLEVGVCHFPPGTSKWNKIEHRLFSFIASNWRGQPLRDYDTVVNLISRTTSAKGLTVRCRLDRRNYATGRKVTDEEMRRVQLIAGEFHGEWNYTIRPCQRN